MVRAFKLPLSAGAFSDALAKGHGRALIHVRRHGLAGLEDFLLHACLHDLTYDRQCEGDRTPWLGEFFEGAPEWIAGPVLNRLVNYNHDIWHHARLGLLFAQRGHPAAREALYTAFGFCEEGADLVAHEEILELDGEQGFLWMAARLGQLVEQGAEVSGQLLGTYDVMAGDGCGAELLRASDNPDVRRYLGHLIESGETYWLDPPARVRPPSLPWAHLTAGDILRRIADDEPAADRYWYGSWGRSASREQLRDLAPALFQPTDPGRLAKLLRCFQARGLPEFDRRASDFADHPDCEVRRLAYWVLSWHHEPEVRSLALSRLRMTSINEGAILLLRRTYSVKDRHRLIHALESVPALDPYPRHCILSDLLKVLQANPHRENRSLLLVIYEHTPCTNCRGEAVKMMIKLGVVPVWVQREWAFDADEESRCSK